MGVILDTSVIIEAEKCHLNFKSFADYGVATISALTVSELLLGVHLAQKEEQKLKRSAFVEKIIKSIHALPFGEEEARTYAQLMAYLWEKKKEIDAHDMMIAATALQRNYPVLTMNKKHFAIVPGLTVLVPQKK